MIETALDKSFSSIRSSFEGSVRIPASKSVYNRVLLIQALCDEPFDIAGGDESDDIVRMKTALQSDEKTVDIHHAGTAMRFLTAYFASRPQERILTGSQRMKERPIGVLVGALETLGTTIQYLENEGTPPLHFTGKQATGGTVTMRGDISSQYISALLMIAPTLPKGLHLRLEGKVVSKPYIDITLALLKSFGIAVEVTMHGQGGDIDVAHQPYHPPQACYKVEHDWTAASYWYAIATLRTNSALLLRGLSLDSVQGDAKVAKWFEPFGIVSTERDEGVHIASHAVTLPKHLALDFSDNPDVAQTFVVLCVLLQIPFSFSGVETLYIKETDRIAALQKELRKVGATLTTPNETTLAWDGELATPDGTLIFDTYQDHRMAMSLALLSLKYPHITIREPRVVEKSYPLFWDEFDKICTS